MKTYFLGALIIFSLLTSVNCTRPSAEKNSSLTIAVPSASQFKKLSQNMSATAVLGHVVINISGAGMAPVVFSWDAHSSNGSTPSAFSFDVPQGSGRLVQFLAVFMESSNQTMYMYYGDKTADFNTAQVAVDIDIYSLTQSVNVSGHISGRYLSGTDSNGHPFGPTGGIEVRYTPPGKQPMIIEKDSILNGWFSVFAMSEIAFDYAIVDGPDAGKKLFNQPVSLESDIFKQTISPVATYPSNIMKGAVPLSQRMNNGTTETNEAKIMLWGWFSDGSSAGNAAISGKYVCPNLPSKSTQTNQYGNPSYFLDYHDTNSNNSFPTSSDLVTISSGTASPTIEYFGGMRNTPCSSAVEYENKITLTPANFEYGGRSVAPFVIPFRILDVANFKIFTGSGGIMSGELLPGTQNFLTELVFYGYPASLANTFPMDDSFPCNAPPSGFLVKSVTNFSDSAQFEIDFTDWSVLGNGIGIGICPKKNGYNVAQGIWKKPDNSPGGGGGGGGGGTPYLRIEGLWNYGHNENGTFIPGQTIQKGICIPVSFNSYLNGSPHNVGLAHNINFGSGYEAFNNESDCYSSSNPITSTTIAASTNRAPFSGNIYLKIPLSNNSTTINFPLTITSVNPVELNYTSDGNFNMAAMTAAQLKFNKNFFPQGAFIYNRCEEVFISAADSSGNNMKPIAPGGLTVTLSGTNASLYTDNGCTSSASSINIPQYGNGVGLFVKTTVASGSVTITPTSMGASYSLPIRMNTDNFVKFAISEGGGGFPGNFVGTVCYPIKIEFVDANKNPYAVPAGQIINLNAVNATVYSDSTCATSVTQVTPTTASTEHTIYARFTGAGNLSVTGATSQSITNIQSQVPFNFNPNSGILSKIEVQGWNNVSYNSCSPLNIFTKDNYNNFALLPSNQTISFYNMPPNFTLYSDSGCTSSVTVPGDVTLNSGNFSYKYYFKSSNTYNGNFSFNYSYSFDGNVTFHTEVFNFYQQYP